MAQHLCGTERLLDRIGPRLVDQNPVVDAMLVDPGGSAEAGRARSDDDDPNLRTGCGWLCTAPSTQRPRTHN